MRLLPERDVKLANGQTREARRLYVAAKGKERRAALRKIKLSEGCMDCGYKENAWALHFDHVLGEKRTDVTSMCSSTSWSRLMDEVAKCDVVCANCHEIRTHGRRIGSVK